MTIARSHLLFVLVAVLFPASQPYAETTRDPRIDYSVISKLEEQKDHPAAPDFVLVDPNGKKRSLKDFRGKLVLLNFWATWCEYCRGEMPAMDRLYRDYQSKGFEIVAVNVKDKRQDALAMVKELKLSYQIMMDSEGEVGLLYGAYGMPTTYLIDAKGKVLARLWGPADWYSPAARGLIEALLAKKKSPV